MLKTMFRSGKPLRTSLVEGSDADEGLLQAMWQLRLDFLELNRSPEEDWQKFRAICRADKTQLITFVDGKNQLQGYYTFSFTPVEQDNRKALLVHSKYYYVRPAYRGHPKIPFAAWQLLPGMIRRFGIRRIYFIAFSFPTSYVSLTRTFGHSMPIQSESTPAWEKAALELFVMNAVGGDWDRQRKLIVNQNVPVGENRPPSKSVEQLRSQYQAYNSHWQEGESLPIMMRFDWGMVKSVLMTSVRRRRRQGR